MVNLVSESFSRQYKAQNIFSTGCLVCICFYLVIILVPFILVILTDGLWIEFKEKSVEPIVSYNNEFILQVLTDSENQFFSTETSQETMNSLNPSALAISTYTIDYDKNSKPELIHLHFAMTKNSNLNLIKGIQLILFFDYKFKVDLVEIKNKIQKKGDINLKTKSLVTLHAESPDGIGKAYLTGNIQFSQRTLLIQGTVPDERYNQSIFDELNENQNDMLYVLEQYHQRNCKNLEFFVKYVLKVTTYADYTKLLFPDQNENEIQIFVDLNIPAIEVVDYSPPLIEKVKFAWVQYFSLFLPLYYILGAILAFIYKEKIATNIEKNNIQNLL